MSGSRSDWSWAPFQEADDEQVDSTEGVGQRESPGILTAPSEPSPSNVQPFVFELPPLEPLDFSFLTPPASPTSTLAYDNPLERKSTISEKRSPTHEDRPATTVPEIPFGTIGQSTVQGVEPQEFDLPPLEFLDFSFPAPSHRAEPTPEQSSTSLVSPIGERPSLRQPTFPSRRKGLGTIPEDTLLGQSEVGSADQSATPIESDVEEPPQPGRPPPDIGFLFATQAKPVTESMGLIDMPSLSFMPMTGSPPKAVRPKVKYGSKKAESMTTEQRLGKTMAELLEYTEPTEKTDYVWPSDVEERLRAERELRKTQMSETDIKNLEERGFYVTEDLGQGMGGQVFKAYTHPEMEMEVPVEPDSQEIGWDVSWERNFRVKQVNMGNLTCALKVAYRMESGEFQNERRILLKINHQNCLRLYGTVWIGTGPNAVKYLVMEYANGRTTLSKFFGKFRTGPKMDEWTARLIMKHMTLGLEYLHSLDIAHSDFHGGNIMPHCERGRMVWKIFDFGYSTIKGEVNFIYYMDLKRFGMIMEEMLRISTMSDANYEGIKKVIDHIRRVVHDLQYNMTLNEGDLDNMVKIAQALKPYFPPDDEPPDGSAAKDFCKEFEE